MEEANFPGADVQFFLDGDIVREVQLKAINSPTLVYEHLERYPDIEILVTEETAAILDGIGSSGLSNAVLSRDVTNRLQDLQAEGLLEVKFVPIPGQWGTLPLSTRGASHGTTTQNIHG